MRLSHTMSAEPMRARHQERESGLSQERESCLSHDERAAACPVRTRRKPRRTQLALLFRSPSSSRSGGSGEVFITRGIRRSSCGPCSTNEPRGQRVNRGCRRLI